jgi:serine/threonine-protein kinase
MTWDEPGTESLDGRVIDGKYELDRTLGTGGMGSVVKARHRFTGRRVALKLLHEHIARSERFTERFLREAQTAAQLRHPRVVDVLDAGRDPEGTLYIAFELLEGEDLNERAQRRKLTLEEMVEVGVQALDGLEAAHAAGLIHRDIKPANIFLERGTRISVKLVDFGIATEIRALDPSRRRLTQAGMVMGTPVFMSPEQMCADPLDGRTDLWSLAVSLYFGLTLTLPFKNADLQPLLLEVMQNGSKPIRTERPDLPEAADVFFRTAFSSALEDRHADLQAMRTALQLLVAPMSLEDETVDFHSSAPDTPDRRRHPGLEALAELEREVQRLQAPDTMPTGRSPAARRPHRS